MAKTDVGVIIDAALKKFNGENDRVQELLDLSPKQAELLWTAMAVVDVDNDPQDQLAIAKLNEHATRDYGAHGSVLMQELKQARYIMRGARAMAPQRPARHQAQRTVGDGRTGRCCLSRLHAWSRC